MVHELQVLLGHQQTLFGVAKLFDAVMLEYFCRLAFDFEVVQDVCHEVSHKH